MVYVAVDPISFLAEIAAHAAISGHIGNQRENARVTAANQVLVPYRPVLDKFLSQELVDGALADPIFGGKPPPLCGDQVSEETWTVETAALFSMTQDQQAILIENLVSLFPPAPHAADSPKKPGMNKNPPVTARKQMVKVVAEPIAGEDLQGLWNNNDGELLKAVSQHLLAQSLDIAVKSAAGFGESVTPYKTYRYREGAQQNMERARLIATSEDRLLVETLRGWLLSIPASEHEGPP